MHTMITMCTLKALHRFCDHPMVGNRFAYILRIGQIESSQKKFIINLFVREFFFKIMKSI